MGRRRRYEKTEPLRLLELWSPGDNYGTPIGCVATTFTLDAGHFEEQCLARFVAMETDPAESARAYLIEREEKLSQVFACVIVDQRHAKDQRSLRWHLLPVRLSGSAIQHAKISLLMWDGHLRIIIGSANLTPFGYRTNLEIATALDFGPDDGLPLAIARGAIDFLQQLSGFAPGTEAAPGPKAALGAFLNDVRRRIARWKDSAVPAGAPYCELVPVLPVRGRRARSAFAQLSALWRGPAAVEATIVSPFFDQTESAIDRMYGELNTLLTTRGARTVNFWSTGRALADGQVEIDIPERLFRSPLKHRSTTHQLGVVEPESKLDDARRPLHAKILALDNHDFALYMQGSSNFTLAGMGLSSTPNVELNIAYVIPGASRTFFQNCMRALPEADDAADATKLLFAAAADASHDDDPNEILLPAGFDEVLFRPHAEGGELLLRLDTALLPARFEIALPHGVVILTNEVWSTVHRSEPELALSIDRPVSSLNVKWLDDSTQWASATWVVNVTDTALLAPPAELRNLDLEDLLLLLTSARPSHWLLADRIAAKIPRDPSCRPVVDPLKKVDSSQFLMRRMRRLARALEGLRVRLEQPVASIEGLRWRLQGPFGPLALGRALHSESGLGAPFFIAEVASAVQDIRWNTGSALRSDMRDAAIAETLRQLKTLALHDHSDTPDNLRDYVVEQLSGVQL